MFGLGYFGEGVETHGVKWVETVGVEDGDVALFQDFDGGGPVLRLYFPFIFFGGRVLVDEVLDVFIDIDVDGSVGGGVELDGLLAFVLGAADLYLLAGYGAIHLIHEWLMQGLGNVVFLVLGDDREGHGEVLLGVVDITLSLL